jgi:hypothetical protein
MAVLQDLDSEPRETAGKIKAMRLQYALVCLAIPVVLLAQNAAAPIPGAGLRPQDVAADARDTELLQRMLIDSDLTEEQAAQLQDAAARRVDRATTVLQKARLMVDAGLAPALSLKDPEQALTWAQEDAEAARARAALVHQIVEMAQLEAQLPEIPAPAPAQTAGVLPAMERFDGNGTFTRSEFSQIKTAFEKQFGKPLPVSADGATAVHRALGFDHSNRVDVALVPDTAEGMWLRHYLEMSAIPYYAFRTFIPGKATAAHIHIGLPSAHIPG